MVLGEIRLDDMSMDGMVVGCRRGRGRGEGEGGMGISLEVPVGDGDIGG